MILGISATKSAIIIAETKGAGDKFVITAIRPIPFQVRSGNDLAELLQSLIALFDRKGRGAGSVIALLKCSSGRFGSCLEAIKGEAMVELAAFQRGRRGCRRLQGCWRVTTILKSRTGTKVKQLNAHSCARFTSPRSM